METICKLFDREPGILILCVLVASVTLLAATAIAGHYLTVWIRGYPPIEEEADAAE